MHLAVDPGLYSVEDLMGVKKGVLVDLLDDVRFSVQRAFFQDR